MAHAVGGFEASFSDEAACRLHLERLRWPGGFACPRCAGTVAWRLARGSRLRCASCRNEISVTAGTVFADSHLPLRTLVASAWYVTRQKSGTSAVALQTELGLGSYRSAWKLLNKWRRVMARVEREPLSGELEADETFVGQGRATRATVAIAVEARAVGESGRVRLRRVADCREPMLTQFLADVTRPGSLVFTDRWQGYDGLEAAGLRRLATSISSSGDPSYVAMPRVKDVSESLRRWLTGIHRGAVRPSHLDSYLDEFAFRFNNRRCPQNQTFARLLEQAMQRPQN